MVTFTKNCTYVTVQEPMGPDYINSETTEK